MVGGVVYWAKHQLFTCARRRGMPLVRSADGDHGSSTSPAIGLGSDFSEEPEYMLIPEVPNKPAGVSAGDVNTKVRRLTETVERLCHRGANQPLQKLLTKVHPADLATVLGGLPDHQVAQVFDAVANKQVAAQALVQVNPRVQELILSETPDNRLVPVLEALPPDERALLIRQLAPEIAERLLSELHKSSQEEIEELLQYAPETAGSIMTTEYFSLHEDMSVEQAIRAVRGHGNVEMVFYLYVTGLEEKLRGVVSMRQLLLAKPELTLREIMNHRVLKVTTDTHQDEVAQLVDKYRLLAIPVVDGEEHLVGMITVDDVIDVLETETTQDMLRMAGTDKSEILTHSPFRIAGIRLPWLLAAFLGGLAATFVIQRFEGILAEVIALSAFLPVIMGMAGNVGVQSATVTVRGLATGSLQVRDIWTALYKEFRVGVILGTFYGIILGLYGWWMFDSLALAQVVGYTIIGNMTGAAVLAILLPMMFQRLGVDPAIATGPFVTTAIDVFGVLNYFVIASAILVLPQVHG